MDFDISHLLEHWDYKPGQVVVRKIKGRDGLDKIQLRVDLGLLQMNVEGRPDGKRPFGHPSLLEYYQARLYKYLGEHDGNAEASSSRRRIAPSSSWRRCNITIVTSACCSWRTMPA